MEVEIKNKLAKFATWIIRNEKEYDICVNAKKVVDEFLQEEKDD